METVKDMTFSYIDALKVDERFGPRDIVGFIFERTYGARYPLDATALRYIRYRRAEKGDVRLVDKHRSIYARCEAKT